jgi:hypothetical protein
MVNSNSRGTLRDSDGHSISRDGEGSDLRGLMTVSLIITVSSLATSSSDAIDNNIYLRLSHLGEHKLTGYRNEFKTIGRQVSSVITLRVSSNR